MSDNELAGLAVLIIFVVIPIVSWAIKKFKGDKDISVLLQPIIVLKKSVNTEI